MGSEAACSVTFRRKKFAGKALLETSELIFHGDLRLKIDFKTVTALESAGGKLKVTWAEGSATFELGDKAETWAKAIRSPKGLLDKLGVLPGQRIVVLGVPDEAFVRRLRDAGAAVWTRTASDADAIFLGAETLAALAGLRRLVPNIKRNGAIWTITPKGKGGIKDTDVMGIAKAAGLVAVKVVAFSETHSANKFVIPRAAR